jgi:hypothetical protein
MSEFTPEEEKLIEEIFHKYINMMTYQVTDDEIKNIITLVWQDLGKEAPEIIVLDSPAACKRACPDISEYSTYWNMWLCSYAATYEFAKTLGTKFDESKLTRFLEWCRCCPFILFTDNKVFASRKPVSMKINDAGQFHSTTGKSFEYADGWGGYTMNGVTVNEQIVMHPETQTIDQIRSESNEEVKRIRIERFGWARYLEGIGAIVIDEGDNYIEGTKEFLIKSEQENLLALMCICPSTGKEFVLEIPTTEGIKTHQEAQMWLSSGKAKRIISAS